MKRPYLPRRITPRHHRAPCSASRPGPTAQRSGSTFGWEVEPAGFTENTGYALPLNYDDKHAIFADVNGDGLTDYIYGKGSTRITWINTGSGWRRDNAFWPPTAFWVYNSESYASGLKRGAVVDANGDGLPDFIQAHPSAASARNKVGIPSTCRKRDDAEGRASH